MLPAGALFGQDEGKLRPRAALQRGVGNVQVDQACDLGHVTKSVLDDHHMVTSTWWAEEYKFTCLLTHLAAWGPQSVCSPPYRIWS